jgi:hypothetical protein
MRFSRSQVPNINSNLSFNQIIQNDVKLSHYAQDESLSFGRAERFASQEK